MFPHCVPNLFLVYNSLFIITKEYSNVKCNRLLINSSLLIFEMNASCYTLPLTATDAFIFMKVNACDTSENEKRIHSSKNQFPQLKY